MLVPVRVQSVVIVMEPRFTVLALSQKQFTLPPEIDTTSRLRLINIAPRHPHPETVFESPQALESMPKKRVLNLKKFHGSSSSSSQGGSAGQNGGDSHTLSVNERLNDLRKAESLEAAQKKRELAERSSQRSVPPELRNILGVAETAPPEPKVGIRVRDRESERERMRTPGPAAPRSWLGLLPAWQPNVAVRAGKRKGESSTGKENRNRPASLLRFTQLTGDKVGFEPSGLVHLTLKRITENWELLDEDDYPALIDIPLRLRIRLLSYLGYYGPPIDADALQALLKSNEVLTTLDLAGLADHAPLTMKKLARLFEPNNRTSIQTSRDVLDSWDAEEASHTMLITAPSISPFVSLTHLCISNPPTTASWRDLLALSKHVPHLTHLSLAHWPRPTLTPNLAMAIVSSQRSPDVRAGGSHYYSNMDQDYSEAASLLRQLSGNLLCLQWLDVEGCAEWAPALATLAVVAPPPANERDRPDGWATRPPAITIFTDNWQNLNFIRCAQGRLPSVLGVEALGPTADREIARLFIGSFDKCGVIPALSGGFPDKDTYETQKRQASVWMECERRLFAAGRRINNIRRARSCKPVTMDFGWIQKAV